MADTIWTAEDVETLKAAVLALASGQSVVSVNYAGPPARSVTYQQLDLSKLRSLLAEVSAAVNTGQTYRRVRYQKGFRDAED